VSVHKLAKAVIPASEARRESF